MAFRGSRSYLLGDFYFSLLTNRLFIFVRGCEPLRRNFQAETCRMSGLYSLGGIPLALNALFFAVEEVSFRVIG